MKSWTWILAFIEIKSKDKVYNVRYEFFEQWFFGRIFLRSPFGLHRVRSLISQSQIARNALQAHEGTRVHQRSRGGTRAGKKKTGGYGEIKLRIEQKIVHDEYETVANKPGQNEAAGTDSRRDIKEKRSSAVWPRIDESKSLGSGSHQP